jgi:beta-glucosidase
MPSPTDDALLWVANDQETKRFKVNAIIDARTLREVYLLSFQMVVRDADPWCMMTAYNKVNGSYCDASKQLLTDIARDEWGWGGGGFYEGLGRHNLDGRLH